MRKGWGVWTYGFTAFYNAVNTHTDTNAHTQAYAHTQHTYAHSTILALVNYN